MHLNIGEIGYVPAGISAEPVAGGFGEMLDRAARQLRSPLSRSRLAE